MRAPIRLPRARRAAAALAAGTVLAAAVFAIDGADPAAGATAGTVSATPQAATPGFDAEVRAIAYGGDTIYLGGSFTVAVSGGKRVARGYLAAVDAATGRLTGWAPAVNGPVTALAIGGGAVYLGGSFTTAGGRAHRHVAKVDADTGAVDQAFRHRISSAPTTLALDGGRLYAGGSFGTVDGASRGHAAAFDLRDNELDPTFRPTLDGTVHSIAVAGSRVYLGGTFHAVNGAGGHARLAAVSATTGATDTSFTGNAPYAVHHVTVADSVVYAALAGPGGRLMAYGRDGEPDWTLTTDGDLSDVAVLDGVVYGGGHFDHACTTARVADTNGDCLDGNERRQKLFATDLSGRLLDWAPQANSSVGVIVLATSASRHALAVGGAFTTFADSTARARFAQFAAAR